MRYRLYQQFDGRRAWYVLETPSGTLAGHDGEVQRFANQEEAAHWALAHEGVLELPVCR